MSIRQSLLILTLVVSIAGLAPVAQAQPNDEPDSRGPPRCDLGDGAMAYELCMNRYVWRTICPNGIEIRLGEICPVN